MKSKTTKLYAVAATLQYSERAKSFYLAIEISESPKARGGVVRNIFKQHNQYDRKLLDELYSLIFDKMKINETLNECNKRIVLKKTIELGMGEIFHDTCCPIFIFNSLDNQQKGIVLGVSGVALHEYGESASIIRDEEIIRRTMLGVKYNVYRPIAGEDYSEYYGLAEQAMKEGWLDEALPPKRVKINIAGMSEDL